GQILSGTGPLKARLVSLAILLVPFRSALKECVHFHLRHARNSALPPRVFQATYLYIQSIHRIYLPALLHPASHIPNTHGRQKESHPSVSRFSFLLPCPTLRFQRLLLSLGRSAMLPDFLRFVHHCHPARTTNKLFLFDWQADILDTFPHNQSLSVRTIQ